MSSDRLLAPVNQTAYGLELNVVSQKVLATVATNISI